MLWRRPYSSWQASTGWTGSTNNWIFVSSSVYFFWITCEVHDLTDSLISWIRTYHTWTWHFISCCKEVDKDCTTTHGSKKLKRIFSRPEWPVYSLCIGTEKYLHCLEVNCHICKMYRHSLWIISGVTLSNQGRKEREIGNYIVKRQNQDVINHSLNKSSI